MVCDVNQSLAAELAAMAAADQRIREPPDPPTFSSVMTVEQRMEWSRKGTTAQRSPVHIRGWSA
jgi:hypothetical protein